MRPRVAILNLLDGEFVVHVFGRLEHVVEPLCERIALLLCPIFWNRNSFFHLYGARQGSCRRGYSRIDTW